LIFVFDREENQGMDENQDTTRRGFLGWATAGIMGFIGLCLSVPLVGYIVSPALIRRKETPIKVGALSQLQPGVPAELEAVFESRDGYLQTMMTRAVWAVKKKSGEIRVYNPHCTHLGCAYRWNAEERLFKCPCHGGVYDIDGKVVAGPPPRPLDTLEYHVEEGKLLVDYEDFKSGSVKKTPI
jgi:menaquinol-cytochrome c reductase iron-sulfur subunit